MVFNVEAVTNCRLIDRPALASEPGIADSAKALLKLMAATCAPVLTASPLSQHQLSRILWAARGLDDVQDPGAGMSSNCFPDTVDVYAATLDGVYLFNPDASFLEHAVKRDCRALCGNPFAAQVPLTLIYVAKDLEGRDDASSQQETKAVLTAGCISRNVTLMCAAEGLASALAFLPECTTLAGVMGLKRPHRVLLTQAIGRSAHC